jgi:general L-amino acid transport system permease protein
MTKINFLKPDISNLKTFLYIGTFLFFISILDVFLKFFFSNQSYWVFTK